MVYRADIDGLRALAVWPVVIFHAELGVLSGGFVGVDIFFVISGYLITGVLLKDLAAGRFSLLGFYERRIRRIFPALFVMLFFCSILQLMLAFPDDLRSFGMHLASASASISNVSFFSEADYFSGDAKLKFLLHTWSLGVEEQFYLIWPTLLLLLTRWRPAHLVGAVAIIAAASLIASAWVLEEVPAAVFYLLPFRAWELLLGGLVATGIFPVFRNPTGGGISAAAGLVLILYSVINYSDQMAFPGLAALVPCVGTALIIHAGQNGNMTAVGTLLSMPLLTFFGKISYSLYLWHWPLFAILRYRMIEEPGLTLTLSMLPLAVICATLSWYFIEQPFRTKQWLPTRRAALFAGCAAMACGVLTGAAFYVFNGFPQRFPAEVNRLAAQGSVINPYKGCEWERGYSRGCIIGDPEQLNAVLWGDSHAGTLWAAVEPIGGTRAIQYAANSACPPTLEMGTSTACIEANRRNLQFATNNPRVETVILAARWSFYFKGRALDVGPAESNAGLPELQTAAGDRFAQFEPSARAALRVGLIELVQRLLASGKTVVLIYPIPEVGYDVPFTLARLNSRDIDIQSFTVPISAYQDRQREAFEMLDTLGTHPGLMRVYPAEVLCPEEHCLTNIGGQSLYMDNNHLSRAGARLLTPHIARAMH